MLRATRQHPDKPTYFRYLNLLAFHAFVEEQVDVAILEVGIGGQYDSTNIVEKPIVCGITALGLDHVNVLGNTIDKIAWHKAGIIKPKAPVVAFEQPAEAMQVIEERAKDNEVSQKAKVTRGKWYAYARVYRRRCVSCTRKTLTVWRTLRLVWPVSTRNTTR